MNEKKLMEKIKSLEDTANLVSKLVVEKDQLQDKLQDTMKLLKDAEQAAERHFCAESEQIRKLDEDLTNKQSELDTLRVRNYE